MEYDIAQALIETLECQDYQESILARCAIKNQPNLLIHGDAVSVPGTGHMEEIPRKYEIEAISSIYLSYFRHDLENSCRDGKSHSRQRSVEVSRVNQL